MSGKGKAIYQYEHEAQQKLEKLIKGLSIYLLSGAAAFSLEVVIYVDKGWEQNLSWWLTRFPATAIWLMAPYVAMSTFILKRQHSFRQLILLLFGSLGITFFGVFILLDAFFIHTDPRSWILYIILPIYQWLAIGGAAAIRHAIGHR